MLLLCCLRAAPAAASWPELSVPPVVDRDGARDAALIVSVERSAALPAIAGATRNGDDWQAFLLARGVPESRLIRLRDSEATASAIRAAAAKVGALVEAGGVPLLVFTGHAVPTQDGKDALLLGAEAPAKVEGLAASGVEVRHLARLLGVKPKQRPLLVLDCAVSGRFAGTSLLPGLAPLGATAAEGAGLGAATVLVGAGGATEGASLPGLDRPGFGYLVLGGSRGWADQDGDGRVTAREALDHAAEALAASGSKAIPELWGSRTVLLVASGVSERAPAPGPDTGSATDAAAAAAAAATAAPGSIGRKGRCPGGMALVESGKEGRTSFCIDGHESPGKAGVRPTVNVTFELAASGCGKLGRRLCTAAEFTTACAGPGKLDYPYGARFEQRLCTTATGDGAARAVGLAGERKLCRSGYGVFDLSGNVAEWVAERVVMGGSGADQGVEVRCGARRAPPAEGRDEWIGYRCCAEPE